MVAKLKVELDGPFFQPEPGKRIRRNIRLLMARVAEVAEADVRARIAAIPPAGVRTGRARSRIVGRTKSLAGKQWALWAVVSPSTSGMSKREAVGLMASVSHIESRAHPFRRSAAALRVEGNAAAEVLLRGVSDGS